MASDPDLPFRRFSTALDAELPDLGRFPNVAEWGEAAPSTLDARWFDTAGSRLIDAGAALEHRTAGERSGWLLHLRTPDGGTRTVPVAGDDSPDATPPPVLRDAVRIHARSAQLKEVARTRTERRTFELRDDSGVVLARVHDDRIEVHPAESDGADSPVDRRRWVFEPAVEDDALLRAAIAALEVAGALTAGPGSHLRSGFDDAPEPDGHPKVKKGSSAAVLIGAVLREQVAELEHRDVLLRLDMPDSVHKLRVAMRQLRSTLTAFRPVLDREQTDPVREEVKWIARVLGEARDAQVARGLLTELLDDEPGEYTPDTVRDRIDRDRTDAYGAARDRAVDAMRGKRYLSLIDSLRTLAASPPWTPLADEPAREVLPALVAKAYRRAKKEAEAAADADEADRAESLHEVRKAAKRARYTAEVLTPVSGSDAKRFAKAMKRVQSVLGDHHDLVVLPPLLRRLAEEADDGASAFVYGRLSAVAEARAAALEPEYERLWEAAARKKLREWTK